MRKLVAPYIIPVIFLLFVSHIHSYAQLNITFLGIEQGLSNNSIRSIYQDKKGFMWFCTYDGLDRYDGYGFKVFRNNINDSNSLVNNVVTSVTEDQRNNLWIATRQGVSIYNRLTGKFASLSYADAKDKSVHKVDNVVKDIKMDKHNNVLTGCEGTGLLLSLNGSFTAGQIAFKSGKTETNAYGVQAIEVDSHERVWALVQNKGLCLFDYKAMKLVLIDSTVPGATCFKIDKNGIWIGTAGGVYYYNAASNTTAKVLDAVKDKMTSSTITTLSLDKNNNVWIGTNGGGVNIYNIASKKLSYLLAGDSKNFISSDAVYSIYFDKESRTWLGTLRGGINIIDPQKERFTTIAHDQSNINSLPGNFIFTFLEDTDSSIWIGTDGKGLTNWNRKKNVFKTYQNNPADPRSLPSNTVTCLKADFRYDMWLASTGGMARFNAVTKTFERFKCINPVTGFESKSFHAVYEDKSHNLWVGTLRVGSNFGALYRFNRALNEFEVFDGSLSDLFSIYEDNSGNFWGGNLSQLVSIDRVNRQHKFYNIGNTVRALYDDDKGNFWVGTEGGGLILFNRKENKISKRYTTDEGLSNNTVLTILDDRQGNLWLSTYNGLSKFNIAQKSFTNYYQSDGLQSNEFHYNAALALQSGEFLFGGIKGFNIFYPGKINAVNTVPNLAFTGLAVNNKPVEQNSSFITKSGDYIQEIKVPYNEAILSIDFTALEYSSPNKISYAYYLQNWDRDWNYSGNTRTASYTHLEEGNYTFRVKSTNAEGIWNAKEISFNIIVLPPWYRTWWAYLVYLCSIGAVIYLNLSYRAKQTKLRYEVTIAKLNADMEHAAYERERAEHDKERLINEREKEINEKKLSFFTNISHEFRNPLTLIINPIKDLLGKTDPEKVSEDSDLNIVYRNARRLLSLVDQTLLFRKSESGVDKLKIIRLNFCQLCKEVFLCFVQQARTQKVTYDFDCKNDQLEVYADREKVEIILYNLISNALKYTDAGGKVTFSVVEGEEDVAVQISDTGRGIPADVQDKLFDRFYQVNSAGSLSKPGFGIGLYLARHFTQEHKGVLTYRSELGAGTTFTLKLLKGKQYFNDNAIVENTWVPPKEVNEDEVADQIEAVAETEVANPLDEIITEKKSILITDDDSGIRQYVAKTFKENFIVYAAASGEEGVKLAKEYLPDIIISDIKMEGLSGIDLCRTIKEDSSLSHIPVILLTGETSREMQLKGVEGGADDYITKPFEKDLLIARVLNLLKSRNSLQRYFYNEITLSQNNIKVSAEYKEFIERCIQIVEEHIYDDDFTVKSFASEIGMSHSVLYKKIKSVSGQSANAFIRFIRLRKAAELFINSNLNVNEVAVQVGINHTKYFREQFNKLFGINPSDYIKKFRKPFKNQFNVNKGSA